MRIRRNSLFNLAGGVVPALAALATMPAIVRGLGGEAYGLLVLVTAIVGYFALLDINITAGSTKYVAEHHARGEQDLVNQTIGFGLLIYAGIGLLGALLLYLLADWLALHVFGIGAAQRALAVSCLRVAALGFFFGQLQMYLQSVPQALMRYDVTARFEMLFGTAVPLGSVLLIVLGHGLFAIVCWRVLLSMLNTLLLSASIRRLLPAWSWARPGRATVRAMSSFSAYAFASRVAALSYTHGDKLIIGSVVGMKALAVYAVAATIGNRVLGMMYRVSAVLFPAASALSASGEEARLRDIYLRLGRYVVYANLSALLLIGVFADPLLRHWIDADYAAGGALVLQLVALAQFVDSLTNLPSLVNDGRGHPRVSGMFALTRALLGLASVFVLVSGFGIVGAAWAHLLSACVMTLAFVVHVHGRTVPVPLSLVIRHSWVAPLLIASSVALLAHLAFQHSAGDLRALIGVASAAIVALAVLGWFGVLRPDDRAASAAWLRARLAAFA